MRMSSSPTKLKLGGGEAAKGTNGGGVIRASGEPGTMGSSSASSDSSGSNLGLAGGRGPRPSASFRARSAKFTTADPEGAAGLPVTIVPAGGGGDRRSVLSCAKAWARGSAARAMASKTWRDTRPPWPRGAADARGAARDDRLDRGGAAVSVGDWAGYLGYDRFLHACGA